MTKRQELIQRIRRHSKDIRLEEVDHLLLSLGFKVKPTSKHHYQYSKTPYPPISMYRHYKTLNSRKVKELDLFLDEIGFYDEDI